MTASVVTLATLRELVEAKSVRAPRPDRAVAMKAANAYGTWLKSEVQGTVDALERGEMPLISEAEMEKRWATKRAALEQRRREVGA